MALGQPHVCITYPCEFCRVTGGNNEKEDGNRRSHQVVAFYPREQRPRPDERLSERLALLTPSQLRLIEAMVDLYLE